MTDIDAIRQRRAAITPGPWATPLGLSGIAVTIAGEELWCRFVEAGEMEVAITPREQPDGDADATFIAHAPDDIDTLLAEVERLREALGEALVNLTKIYHEADRPPIPGLAERAVNAIAAALATDNPTEP